MCLPLRSAILDDMFRIWLGRTNVRILFRISAVLFESDLKHLHIYTSKALVKRSGQITSLRRYGNLPIQFGITVLGILIR